MHVAGRQTGDFGDLSYGQIDEAELVNRLDSGFDEFLTADVLDFNARHDSFLVPGKILILIARAMNYIDLPAMAKVVVMHQQQQHRNMT
jgi:hypothetical protein